MAVSLSEDIPPSNGPICPVCFRDYSDNESNLIPRILQCGHTYCTECLDRLLNTEPDEDDFEQVVLQIRYGGREWTTVRRQPLLSRTFASNDLKCPTCNTMNYINNRDVHTLTKNFALLGCRPANRETNVTQRQTSTSKHFCSEHAHEKRVYCRDCRELVCAYCQLYGVHKNHDCLYASDAAEPSVEALKAAMDSVNANLKELNIGDKHVNRAARRLKKNKHQCEKKVKGYFDQLIQSLESKKNTLLMDIGSWTDEQMFILNAQLQSLASAISDSDNLQKTCGSLIKGDPLDALSQQDDVIKEITELQARVQGLALKPLINPWIKCDVNDVPDDVLSDLLKNCTLMYDTDAHSGDETMLSDLDPDHGSLSDDEFPFTSDREDSVNHRNRLTQEGAGASASPATKGKQKYYQETQALPRWTSYHGDGASMMPTLDSPHFPSWSTNQQQHSNQAPNQPSTSQGAFPSAPNNAFLSATDVPTSQASDQNSMFLNPISKKAKYTNLLHTHSRRLRALSDSVSNSDDDDIAPSAHLSQLIRNLSSSDSHHSEDDDENGSGLLDVSSILGSSYVQSPRSGLRNASRYLRPVYNRSLSLGDMSASPDEDERDSDHGSRVPTGELFAIPNDPVPRNSTCQSPDNDDFTYTHHLTSLHSEANQSNEIVIPHHQPYWSSNVPPNRILRSNSNNNRGNGGDAGSVSMVIDEGLEEAEPPDSA